MNNESIRNHYSAFTSIEAFGLKYSASFPATGRARILFAAIAAVVPEMERLGVGQLTGSIEYHSGTSAKRQLADELRDKLRTLRDTAQAIGLAEGQPAFAKPYQLPKSKSYAALMTQVRTALEAARPHVDRFTEFELPEGHLDRMTVALGQLEHADEAQEAGLSSQIGGTAGLAALVDRGMELRKQLAPLVRNRFESEPSVWAEWQSASRVVRVNRSRDEESSPEEATTVA